jgi:hypothetical protein
MGKMILGPLEVELVPKGIADPIDTVLEIADPKPKVLIQKLPVVAPQSHPRCVAVDVLVVTKLDDLFV